MVEPLSCRITLTIPTKLLQQVDNLAKHNLATRSDTIRLALLEYVRKSENKLIADPNTVAIKKAYEYIKDDHPYLNPNDAELIMFFSEQKAAAEKHAIDSEV